MLPLYNICWLLLAQITPGASTAEGAAEAVGEAAKKPGMFDTLTFFLPAMMIVMVLYFLMMGRPQDKGQVKGATPERLANLKKNDRVVTSGGIIGTVVNMREDVDHLTIRVDESTGSKIQVLKQSIVRVLNDDEKDA